MDAFVGLNASRKYYRTQWELHQMDPIKKRFALPFVLLFLSSGLWTACNEKRFEPSQKKRSPRAKSRLRAAPRSSKKGLKTQATSIPTSLRAKSKPKLALLRNTSHSLHINAIAVSPAGDYALTAGEDHLVIKWKLPYTKRLHTYRGFKGPVRDLVLSPDGRRFAALEGHQWLSLWSINGNLLHRIALKSPIHAIQFAPIDNQVWGISSTGKLFTFQGTKLALKQTFTACPKSSATSFALDTLQRFAIVGCQSGTIWTHSLSSKLSHSFKVNEGIRSIVLVNGGQHYLAGTDKASIIHWTLNAQTLKSKEVKRYRGHIRSVEKLLFSSNGKQLYSYSMDQTIARWQVGTKGLKLEKSFPLSSFPTAMAILPEQKGFLGADQASHFYLWNAKGVETEKLFPPSDSGPILTVHPKRGLFLTSGEHRSVAGWDLESGERTMAITKHPGKLIHTQFSRNGNYLLTVGPYNALFWDFNNRSILDVIRPQKWSQISSASLGRDQNEVFFGTPRSGIFLWTIAGQHLLYHHSKPQLVSAVAVNPITKYAVAGTMHGKIYYYNLISQKLVTSKVHSSEPIRRLVFSSKGKQLLIITGKKASLWKLSFKIVKRRRKMKLTKVQEIQHTSPLYAGAFSPDKKQIALAAKDNRVLLWDLQGKKIAASLYGCDSSVRLVEYFPKHPLLAANCQNGRTQIWHLPTQKWLTTHVALPKKNWLVYTPKFFFSASDGAFDTFSFKYKNKKLPLSAFKGWFFSPEKVKAQFATISPASSSKQPRKK